MHSWIRTDWWYPVHMVRFVVSVRELATMAGELRKALEGSDPAEVERQFMLTLAANHQGLEGGQLVSINQHRYGSVEFLYVHRSLPAVEMGSEPGKRHLFPTANGMVRWFDEQGHEQVKDLRYGR